MKIAATLALLLAGLVASAAALPTRPVGDGDAQLVLGADADADLPLEDQIGSVSVHSPYNDSLYAKMAALRPPAAAAAKCPDPAPKFACPATGTKLPAATNVNELRPKDIAAIMALGDSVTAGFVMTSGSILTARILEDRGKVYTTGGDKGVVSLANFLKVYNPNLVGDCTGTTTAGSAGKELNVAVTGARVEDLPAQIKKLKSQLATKQYTAVADKWKLLTIFIGANNLCNVCTETNGVDADHFEKKLREAIQLIHEGIPKTFVAIITTFRVSQVWNAAQTTTYCKSTFNTLNICACAGKSDATRKLMDDTGFEYNRRAAKIAEEIQALKDPEFTVSIVPGISEQDVAKYGQCYLSNFDCFHPNQEADAVFAISVWNNLFEPKELKTPIFDVETLQPYCPDDSDVFM